MNQYIAFLRGINLGRRRVKMDHLRSIFEELKFSGVSTFIASGNVVFETRTKDAARIEKQIERHLKHSLGYEVDTFLRTRSEISTILAFQPFSSADLKATGHSLYVAFLRDSPGGQVNQKLLSCRTPVDDLRVRGRELYWLCRGKLTDSMVSGALLAKTIGMSSTMRNVTALHKLAARFPAVR